MAEEIGSVVVNVGMDSSGFQNGINALSRQMRVVQSQFQAASASLGGFRDSTEQLRLRASSLTQQIDIQRQRVAALQEAYDRSVASTGADSEATQGLEIRLNRAQAQLSNMQNQLESTNTRIANQTNGWRNLSTSLSNISDRLGKVGKAMSDAGKKLTTTVTVPLIGIGIAAEKTTLDFEDGMAKISTVADTSKISLNKLGDGIVNLSNQTGQAATDIQEGLYDAISSGVDTAKAVDFMTVAVKAAKGGFTDTKTSVDGLTTTLNAYGLQAEKATEISNEMMVAQNLGKTTFGEMAASIGNVVPTAASLKITTKELFSSLATLTANGIDTSEAVTGLKEAFSNIIKPSSQAVDMAKKLGIQFNATHLQSVGWGQFLTEVQKKTGGNTAKMAHLFGSVEALNSVLTLTSKQGTSLFNESMKQMGSGTNYVDKAFKQVTDTDGAKLRKTFNDLKNASIQLGTALTPIIEKLAGVLQTLANKFKNMTPAQQAMIVKIGLIVAAVGPALMVIGTLITTISTAAMAFAKASTAIAEAGGIIEILTGPIGIAIAAVAALITVGVLLYKHWDQVKAFAIKTWGAIGDFFVGVGQKIGGVWQGVKDTTMGIWNGMWNGIKTFINFIIKGWNFMINALNKLNITVPNWVPVLGGKSLGFHIPNIPMLKDGGIVNRPTLAMFGEAGPEAAVPLAKLPDLMAQAMRKAGLNSGRSATVHIDKFINQSQGDNNRNLQQLQFLTQF